MRVLGVGATTRASFAVHNTREDVDALIEAMIDHGLDIQEAIEMPRFLSGRFGLGDPTHAMRQPSRPEAILAE